MNHFRSTAFILATLFASTLLLAQGDKTRVKVRMGMEGEGDARLPAIQLMKTGTNGVLLQRQRVDEDGVVKGRLDLYDRTKLGFLRTQPPVEKLTSGAFVIPDQVIGFAGRTIMVAHQHGAGSTDLHYQILEPNITRLPPPYEKLCSWPVPLPGPSPVAPGNFDYTYSPDSALLLLHSPMVQVGGGHKALLGLWSKDMSIRWQQILPGGEGAIRSAVLDAVVDTSGAAYLLVSDRTAKSEVLDGKPTTRITLYRVSKDGITVAPLQLPKEKFLTHAVLRRMPDGKLVLGAVYGLVQEDRIVIQGDLLAAIGADGQVAEPLLIPHATDGALIAEGEPAPIEGQKFLEKDVERLMTGIRLVDVLPRSNGGYFLVKELYFMETYMDLKAKRQANRYIHGPLQATGVGAGGAVEWNTLFRRWHKSGIPGTGEVLAGVFADELFVFVLDSEAMAAARKSGAKMTPELTDGPFTAHLAFDAKGVVKAKPVLKSGSETGYLSGTRLYRLGANEYYAIGSEKPEGGRTLPVRIDLSTETK